MPRKLSHRFVQRVWGETSLEPWYPNQDARTGEVWFETVADPPLLVKFIFTSEALSIQVHPNDEQAKEAGHARGKTEMWVVLRARPGATIGVGLRTPVAPDHLRAACESGEVERLLDWKPARAGDAILVHAGTIHAIGPGLVLCEIQQNSDVTYRLYDYGRPRELHLDQGIAVADPSPHPGATPAAGLGDGVKRLAACEYFVTDEFEVTSAREASGSPRRPEILIAIEGAGRVAGEPYRAGEAWLVQAGEPAFRIEPETASRFLRTYAPS